MKAVELNITGRVQGVSYRASTRARAVALGVVGWVRNEPDGSVRAWAQGPPALVDALLSWCGSGPPHARVDEVRVKVVTPDATLASFDVRPTAL
ncbi:MAG: acylphosphatase [Nannocystaceae bacterium]|nr:acylphosphatase [Nannocystaceae bacterium]